MAIALPLSLVTIGAILALLTPPSAEAQASTPTHAELEALTRRVLLAVESGRDSAERTHWLARAVADPLRARLAVATLDRLGYRYADAERAYLALAADAGAAVPVRHYARLGLGMLRAQQTRVADAAPLLATAARELEASDAAAGRAHALMLLATVTLRTAGVDSARVVMHAAAQAVPDGDEWLRTLVACNDLVIRARGADHAVAARARATSAQAIRAGNPRAAAACLAALAQDHERRTSHDSAMAVFDEVAALQRRARNWASLAGTLQWQGYVLAAGGQPARARPKLEEAVALARRTKMLVAWGYADLSLANIALAFDDLPGAGRHARSAAAVFARIGDRSGLTNARQHEGDVALLGGAAAAARDAFEAVVRESRTLFPTLAVHARGRLAAVALLEGDWPQAERELDLARVDAARLDMPEWRQEDSYFRGLLALARGNLDDAIARWDALRRSLPATDLGVHADLLTRLAEAHGRAGRPAVAESLLVRAGALVDERRRQLPQRDLQAAVVGARAYDWDRDLGFATALAGLAHAGRADAAFRLAEQRRARLLLEAILRREALAGRDAGATRPAAVVSAAEARATLPESTAVLAYVTGRRREPTTVFVLTRDTLRVVDAPPLDDHADDITRFVGLLAADADPSALARRLGDAFVGPALATLPTGVRRVVIVPDGALHRLPFDALVVRDTLLVDRAVVSLAPSVAAASAWWRRPPRPPRPRLLAFGDPLGVRLAGSAGDSVPPRLPVAAREAAAVARFASAAEVFVGAEAREARVRRASLADVGVLHFATHAEVEDWSLLGSALLLAPGDGEDGRLTADELLGLDLGANLVVLSACRSGGGAVLAGEGLAGLVVPVLESGAAAVVASLWQVGDRSVEPMIALFYDELATGAPVADALRAARRAARAREIPTSVWAAFTVTGDPRVATALRAPAPARARLALGSATLAIAVAIAAYFAARTRSSRKGERR